MSSYFQLQSHDPDTPDVDEAVKHPLLNGEGFSEQDGIVSTPKGRSWSDWLTLGLSVLLLATSFALYVDSTKVITPRSADGLRKPDAYPGLDEVPEFRKKKKGAQQSRLRASDSSLNELQVRSCGSLVRSCARIGRSPTRSTARAHTSSSVPL